MYFLRARATSPPVQEQVACDVFPEVLNVICHLWLWASVFLSCVLYSFLPAADVNAMTSEGADRTCDSVACQRGTTFLTGRSCFPSLCIASSYCARGRGWVLHAAVAFHSRLVRFRSCEGFYSSWRGQPCLLMICLEEDTLLEGLLRFCRLLGTLYYVAACSESSAVFRIFSGYPYIHIQ